MACCKSFLEFHFFGLGKIGMTRLIPYKKKIFTVAALFTLFSASCCISAAVTIHNTKSTVKNVAWGKIHGTGEGIDITAHIGAYGYYMESTINNTHYEGTHRFTDDGCVEVFGDTCQHCEDDSELEVPSVIIGCISEFPAFVTLVHRGHIGDAPIRKFVGLMTSFIPFISMGYAFLHFDQSCIKKVPDSGIVGGVPVSFSSEMGIGTMMMVIVCSVKFIEFFTNLLVPVSARDESAQLKEPFMDEEKATTQAK
jgi:hypothetical protein